MQESDTYLMILEEGEVMGARQVILVVIEERFGSPDEAVPAQLANITDLERLKRINVDLLATYMPHPGAALYVGYGDRYENLALPSMLRVSVPGYSTGRQVFVKLSYMLRL